MQQGDAARPLPERPAPADVAAAPPRRTARYEEIDWDTAIAEVAAGFQRDRATSTAASRSSTTAAAARATTSAAPTAARSCKRARRRATARARSRRRRPARPGSTRSSTAATRAASSSTPRCRCSSARTRGCRRASRARGWCCARSPRTRSASMIVIDPVVTDTAKLADFHLRVRPGTDAWCLAALAACSSRRTSSTTRSSPSTSNGAEPVLAALARGADRRLRGALRRRRGADPRGRAADRRRRRASRCSRTSASSRRPNSTLCSYLNKLLWILTGNFAKPGGQHLHSWMAPLLRHAARSAARRSPARR